MNRRSITSVFIAVVVSSVLLAACRMVAAHPDEAAVITHPDDQSRAEIRRVISQALNGAPLTLTDDALTIESTVIIEPVRRRDASGAPLDGRDLRKPQTFQLVKNGNTCILLQQGTKHRWPLKSVTCALLGKRAHLR